MLTYQNMVKVGTIMDVAALFVNKPNVLPEPLTIQIKDTRDTKNTGPSGPPIRVVSLAGKVSDS